MSLNFSDSPPFHDLGNMTAVGVVAAWFYSIAFLPALIAVIPLRVKLRADTGRSAMERLAEFVIARRRVLIWGTAAVVVGLGAMVPRIELNDQFVQYFDESIPFRADTDFAMENLSGIYQVNWSVHAAEPQYAWRRPGLVQAARRSRTGGAISAALRDVATLRVGFEQPDQHRQIGNPADRDDGKLYHQRVAGAGGGGGRLADQKPAVGEQ
jgi:hypothetical protein